MKKLILLAGAYALMISSCKKRTEDPAPPLDDDGHTAESVQIAELYDGHIKLETGELKWNLDTNNLKPVARYAVLFKNSFQPPLAMVYNGTEDGREQAGIDYGRNAKTKIRNHFRPGLVDDQKISTWFTALSSGFVAELTADEVKEFIRDTAVKAIEEPPTYIEEGGAPALGEGTYGLFIHGYKTFTNTNPKRIWIIDGGTEMNDLLMNIDGTNSKNFTNVNFNVGANHGCKVAHVAASKEYNTDHVRGTAEGAKVVILKVSNNGTITWESVNAALEHCWYYSKNGDIVNMSISTTNTKTSLKKEVEKNILAFQGYDMPIVIAGGNQNTLASNRSPACLGLMYKDAPATYKFLYVICNVIPTSPDVSKIQNRTTDFYLEASSNYGRAIRYGVIGTWTTIDADGYISKQTGTSYAAPAFAGMLYGKSPSVNTFNSVLFPIKYTINGSSYTHLVPTLF